MPKPGTYPTDGDKIESLRRRLKDCKSYDDFLEAATISRPTLMRAESGGPCHESTLRKLAAALKISSWEELRARGDQTPIEKPPPDAVRRQFHVPVDYNTCDETREIQKIEELIEALLQRKIPFFVTAFMPSNSVIIDVLLNYADAFDIDYLFSHSLLSSYITAITHFPADLPLPKSLDTFINTLHLPRIHNVSRHTLQHPFLSSPDSPSLN